MNKEYHIVVSKDTHLRIMKYKLNKGFKSVEAILKAWMDEVDGKEAPEPFSFPKDEQSLVSEI